MSVAGGSHGAPVWVACDPWGAVSRLLLYINRRSGVAHIDHSCSAIAAVPARYLRLELFDPNRPRRRCSRCWSGGGRRMNSPVSPLAHDANLSWRAREDFGHAAIAADQASDADGLAAVTHLWPAERAAIFNPDHGREAPWVRVVDAEVEERRRAGAGRGEACAGNTPSDGGDATDGASGVLPRDRAATRDGARRGDRRSLNSRARTGCRYRGNDKEKSNDLPQIDAFRLLSAQHHAAATGRQQLKRRVGSSNT